MLSLKYLWVISLLHWDHFLKIYQGMFVNTMPQVHRRLRLVFHHVTSVIIMMIPIFSHYRRTHSSYHRSMWVPNPVCSCCWSIVRETNLWWTCPISSSQIHHVIIASTLDKRLMSVLRETNIRRMCPVSLSQIHHVFISNPSEVRLMTIANPSYHPLQFVSNLSRFRR
jgi:hypothetical protein